MILEKTYKDLLELSADIAKQQEASPAFAVMHYDKIQSFYENNRQQLSAASAMVEDLLIAFVEKDAEGKFKSFEMNGRSNWVFINGFAKERYEQLYQEFLNRPVKIHI